jgi:phosphatidylserine decarboxylase
MSASTEQVEVYLTPQELLARWKGQVAAATLATWRSRGGGPAFTKLGGRVVYSIRDVEAYEARNRRT